MNYTEKLKQIRETLLLSQDELAKELGVTFGKTDITSHH